MQKNHPIVPNQRVQSGWFQLAGANVWNWWTFRELSWSLSALFAGSYHLENWMNFWRNLFLGILQLWGIPLLTKPILIRSFHTGCKLVNFVVAAVRPVVSSASCWRKWWSTSVEEPWEALDGEATDLTQRVYNGFCFSQKKRMGVDSFHSDCFRETTCRLIYGIYIEFIWIYHVYSVFLTGRGLVNSHVGWIFVVLDLDSVFYPNKSLMAGH